MITDADWNEAVELAKARLTALAGDVVGSGVPAEGGVVRVVAPGEAVLSWGVAYAEGVRAVLAPITGEDAGEFDAGAQADLLAAAGGTLVDGAGVYLDVWEQSVVSALDPALPDPGLNGADTSFRTRVLAQLKQCELVDGTPTCADEDLNPRRGTASLEAELEGFEDDVDPCDPCADEVSLPQRAGNFLFRLEVHDVVGPASRPESIVLKWSAENAAEQYRLDVGLPPWFTADEHVLEYMTARTEQNLGVFLSPFPEDATGPGVLVRPGLSVPDTDVAGDEWVAVRRWDGSCTVVFEDGGQVAEGWHRGSDLVEGAGTRVALTDDGLALTVSGLRLRLLRDEETRWVRGDHWLVEVREALPPATAARVVSADGAGGPIGVEHRYLYLGVWRDDRLELVDDAARRRLSFPRLTDLPADAIAYEPGCEQGPYSAGVDTVRAALDALCDLDAGHVGYKPSCDSLTGQSTVAAALDRLCEEVESRVVDCWPTLVLFGRGVVCGVVPTGSFRTDEEDAAEEAIDDLARRATATPEEHTALTAFLDDVRGRQGTRDQTIVRFATDEGVVVDGKGCVHRVPALSLSHLVRSHERRLRLGAAGRKKLRERLLQMSRERPTLGGANLNADTWEHDLAARVDPLLEHVQKVEAHDEAELARAVHEVGGWRSSRLRDAVVKAINEAMTTARYPFQTTGWLYMVFDTAGPALEFRTTPPDPWLTAPSVLTSDAPRVKASTSRVESAMSELLEGTEVDVPEVVARIEEARSPEEGTIPLITMAREIGEARGETLSRSRLDDIVGELTVALQPEDPMFTIASREHMLPREILQPADPGHILMPPPDRILIPDETTPPEETTEDVWLPYREPTCATENDGSVCLAKIGVWGTRVVVAPDDREQLFATPANLSAARAARMPRAFDTLLAQAKAAR